MPAPSQPRRKKIRVDHGSYSEVGRICSLTLTVAERAPAFADAVLANETAALLIDLATRSVVPLYAYCLMPDHAHLLAGPGPRVSLFDLVGRFKSLSTRLAWQHGYSGVLWQKRFYDRFLGGDEDNERAAQYILNNPVRKGLVNDWKAYPYCGSLVFDL